MTTTTQTTAKATGGSGVRGSRGRGREGPHHHQQDIMIFSLRREPPLLVGLRMFMQKKTKTNDAYLGKYALVIPRQSDAQKHYDAREEESYKQTEIYFASSKLTFEIPDDFSSRGHRILRRSCHTAFGHPQMKYRILTGF